MTGTIRILIILAVIFSTLAIETDSVSACSCVIPGPPDEELAQATAVFAGKVVGVAKPIDLGQISSADPIKVTFQVFQVWKGSVTETTIITTSRSGASCGYTFEEGGEYIVYAYGQENDLSVSLCSRTQPLDAAVEDLEVLGAGAPPLADSSMGTLFFADFQGPVLLGIGMGIALLLIIMAGMSKRD